MKIAKPALYAIGPVVTFIAKEKYDGVTLPIGHGYLGMRCYRHSEHKHGDRTASGRINHDLGTYNCFSCKMKGNAVTLVMREYGLTKADALAKVQAILGSPAESVRSSTWGSRGSKVSGKAGTRWGR